MIRDHKATAPYSQVLIQPLNPDMFVALLNMDNWFFEKWTDRLCRICISDVQGRDTYPELVLKTILCVLKRAGHYACIIHLFTTTSIMICILIAFLRYQTIWRQRLRASIRSVYLRESSREGPSPNTPLRTDESTQTKPGQAAKLCTIQRVGFSNISQHFQGTSNSFEISQCFAAMVLLRA